MADLREAFELYLGGDFLESKRRKFVVEPMRDDCLFAHERQSRLGCTEEVWVAHWLGCSHLALGPQEFIGECQYCYRTLCFRPECSSRCVRCNVLGCADCVRVYDGTHYCRGCRNMVLLKNGIVTGLRGLHALLSKEV